MWINADLKFNFKFFSDLEVVKDLVEGVEELEIKDKNNEKEDDQQNEGYVKHPVSLFWIKLQTLLEAPCKWIRAPNSQIFSEASAEASPVPDLIETLTSPHPAPPVQSPKVLPATPLSPEEEYEIISTEKAGAEEEDIGPTVSRGYIWLKMSRGYIYYMAKDNRGYIWLKISRG